MMHWIITLCWLVIAGIAAGTVSSAAGLASLVSYPALLLMGMTPVAANVTNSLALVTSGLSAVLSSRYELKGQGRRLLILLPMTIVGAILGALLLFALPATVFKMVVPFFIALAGIIMLFPPRFHQKEQHKSPLHRLGAWALAFLVCIYTGYFGAGGGVVMLLALFTLIPGTFAQVNAVKNAVLVVANLLTAIVYLIKTQITWQFVIPMACGFFIGGYLGPLLVRHLPDKVMHRIVGSGAIVLAIVLFCRYCL
ncbi:sulfite exporter TauE/SafE family protein [Ligilactobacillus sp. LYQ60]|uniref:sulfite exporter TauE/SafE family protein n=1 Tax=unclassified Ligilactobacillus TaxID=2767920 RepID=UPI003854D276